MGHGARGGPRHGDTVIARRIGVCLQALWRLECWIHRGTVEAVENEGVEAMVRRLAPEWRVHHKTLRAQIERATAKGRRWRMLIQAGGWPSPVEVDPSMLGEGVEAQVMDAYVLGRLREGAGRSFGFNAPPQSVWLFPAHARRAPVAAAIASGIAIGAA